jgi:hypothetical protein
LRKHTRLLPHTTKLGWLAIKLKRHTNLQRRLPRRQKTSINLLTNKHILVIVSGYWATWMRWSNLSPKSPKNWKKFTRVSDSSWLRIRLQQRRWTLA